jgi:predicted nucleic acid-binding protein
MLIGFDSNILAYLAGVNRGEDDVAKIGRCRTLLGQLSGKAACITSVQALGELFVVLTRAGASRDEARAIVLRFREGFTVAGSEERTLMSALDLAVAHRLQLWDSLILSAAADCGCAMLLSEDMQDGFVWRGVTVVNPLLPGLHRRLAEILV